MPNSISRRLPIIKQSRINSVVLVIPFGMFSYAVPFTFFINLYSFFIPIKAPQTHSRFPGSGDGVRVRVEMLVFITSNSARGEKPFQSMYSQYTLGPNILALEFYQA